MMRSRIEIGRCGSGPYHFSLFWKKTELVRKVEETVDLASESEEISKFEKLSMALMEAHAHAHAPTSTPSKNISIDLTTLASHMHLWIDSDPIYVRPVATASTANN